MFMVLCLVFLRLKGGDVGRSLLGVMRYSKIILSFFKVGKLIWVFEIMSKELKVILESLRDCLFEMDSCEWKIIFR